MSKTNPAYPVAFRTEAVELVRTSEQSIPVLARDLGVSEQALRDWVRRADIEAGQGPAGALTSAAAAGEQGAAAGTGDSQKSRGLLREGDVVSRYRFVAAEKATYPITILCRVLEVSRSGWYAWRGRAASARAGSDAAPRDRIQAIHTASRAVYGAPRVHAVLRAEGARIGRKRVARLMRSAQLAGIRRGAARPRTTIVNATQPVAPNLVARTFTSATPNRLWVGDLTYLPTNEGWLYLAVVLDVCSRRMVGWAMDDRMPVDLPLAALRMALRRRPAAGTIHHTDRGSQYSAAAYRAALTAHGLVASMSRTGDCYDNAMAESFFATLKTELVDRQRWFTRRAARQAVFEWIEVFYNRQRLHSSLGYATPVAFEERRQPMPIAA